MNRYKIGDLIVYVTFYKTVNMKGLCAVHVGEKEFIVSTEFLKLIATPAP